MQARPFKDAQEAGSEAESGGVSGNSQESHGEEKDTTNIENGETTEGGRDQSETTLLDVVRTLYAKGKEVASKLFGRRFFDVAQTPKFMQELGLSGDKFTIRYGVIARHFGKDSAHTLSQEIWEQLPEAVASPIAVSNNYGTSDNRSILTELKTAQGDILVTLTFGRDADADFNIVSSVFGKTPSKILDWINKGYATYINKEKALSFLSHQSAPIAEAANNSELSTATKIVEDFENPTLPEEDTLFRRYGGRRWYGGNSGYVGYSMSVRADDARDEGRFPKTDFKKEYGLSPRDFDE